MNNGRDDMLATTKVIVYQNMGSPTSPVTRYIHVGPDGAIPLRDNNSECIGSAAGTKEHQKTEAHTGQKLNSLMHKYPSR